MLKKDSQAFNTDMHRERYFIPSFSQSTFTFENIFLKNQNELFLIEMKRF